MVSTSVVLVATGLDVPPYAVSNQVLVDSFNTYVRNYNKAHEQEIEKGILSPKRESDEEFIVKVSGIKSRYFYAPEGILDPLRMKPIIPARPENQLSFQAEKGMIAAKRAMAEAKVGPEDIDLVILACSNMQRPYPAVAVEIQHSLAIEGAAFDMNVACSSATFGIAHATDAIRTGRSKGALVISVEICSAHLNFRDRDSHFIFGDATTAVVLQRGELTRDRHQGFEIEDARLFTQFSNAIRNDFGFLNRADPENKDDGSKLFRQQGRKVFKEVCPAVIRHIGGQLAELSITPQSIKRFWLHQANSSMNELVARKLLGRPATEKEAPIILDEFANTSSAGCIIALNRHHQDLEEGELGVLSSFGAGYSIGSVLLRKR